MAIGPPSLKQASAAVEQWHLLQPSAAVQGPAARGKILIVDDSAANRQSLRTMLGEIPHELSEANTTSEAIGAISLHRVDLVLIDVAAQELGAVEFCRMLKKASATQFLPVFVMAERDDLESEVLAIEAGADEFLVAPLRPRAFLARVQASLRHKAMIDSLDDSETVLFSLAQSVEERDRDLGQHCQRLALMAAAMGLALDLSPSEILALQRGGYLHDVGKVAIPDHILFKPGPLTPEEWEIMKTHAERGERICSSMRSLAQVLPIIRHHHERWDGSGYPDGLKGEEIPLLARILQMADIYDALTTARPYKRALSPDEALDVLREEVAKGWRDPKLVETFSDILPMFRTPTPPDFSRLSLHALAASIERFRKNPSRSPTRAPSAQSSEHLKLVSGL
ncbi:MAG TPA: HD domain-containing phosphohydrolase [Bryobacteraceae bacterium]|nr:HD domain-containing phosphohydrolase [Bryobacteraceae bacterium]